MIAGAGKAAAKVVGGKVMLRVATVGTGGGAVDDDKVDGSGNRKTSKWIFIVGNEFS